MDARERTGAERAARQAVIVTIVLAFAKVAILATTGSLAVLSQALDSILDVVALTLVLVGIRLAGKPPDTSHHYGHGKVGIVHRDHRSAVGKRIISFRRAPAVDNHFAW